MSRRAIFLDRDGTLVHARHYPTRPDELVLFDGVATRLARLRADGYALVMITNQSGLARGLFSADDLDRMHIDLQARLGAEGAEMDAIHHCPHHPEGVVEALAIDCGCRKPRPGMLLRAAADLGLDLDGSWFVGDILDDVEAGNRAGCRTVLVDLGTESTPTSAIRTPTLVARSTAHALDAIRAVEGIGAPADLTYLPDSWAKSTALDEAAPPAQAGARLSMAGVSRGKR